MPFSSTTGPRQMPGDRKPQGRSWKRISIEMLVGGVFGFVGVMLAAHFFDGSGVNNWKVAEIVSFALAGILTLIGVAMVFMARTTTAYQAAVRVQNPDDELPDADEVALVRWQGILLAVTGPLFIAPVILAHQQLGRGALVIASVVLVAALMLHNWLNWQLYRRADELMRRVIIASCAISFFAAEVALFIWASLAKLGVVAEVDSWTLLTVLMIGYLLISGIVATRRGLA